MDLKGQRVLFISQYSAPYEGNFILSLKSLEKELLDYDCQVGYVFPKSVEEQKWYNSFVLDHNCFTTCTAVSQSKWDLVKIFKTFRPTLVHTHFDGYDLPVKNACKEMELQSGLGIVQVWHLHDQLTYVSNPLKKLYQFVNFIRHYRWGGESAHIVAVSDEVLRFVTFFKTMFGGKDYHKTAVIPNGIDLSRLNTLYSRIDDGVFRFLAFGGRNVQKRIDYLCDAAHIIYGRGRRNFEVYITQGTDTLQVVKEKYGSNIPDWLKIVPQSNDIGGLYASVDCFVSTSVAETFSYAICEASIFGLPVIQSDIEGTIWNADNPSTFLFHSGNIDSLVHQMELVLDYPKDELKKQCSITQQNNKQLYTVSAWCGNIINYYKSIRV